MTEQELHDGLRRCSTPRWPYEKQVALVAGYHARKSTNRIGFEIGVTKNAVVGRVHRLIEMGFLIERPLPDQCLRLQRGYDGPRAEPKPRRVTGPTLPPLASVVEPPPSPPVVVAPPQPRPMTAPDLTRRQMVAKAAANASKAKTLAPLASVAPVRPAAFVPLARPTGRAVQCCWPIGEPRTKAFRFCDAPAEPGRPYCEDHVKIAYVKVQRDPTGRVFVGEDA